MQSVWNRRLEHAANAQRYKPVTRCPRSLCLLGYQAVRGTHVNIVDLIEWGRSQRSNAKRVHTFRTLEDLRVYTKKTGKIFRNPFNEEDSNVILRHLLRRIFRENL